MKNLRRMWAVALKEIRQMRRDRISVVMIVAIPVVDLLLFGYAINYNPRNLQTAVVDQAMTSASRAAVMDMDATGIIDVRRVADTPQELVDMLRRGQVSVGIAVPPDYERRLLDGRPAVQVMVDGTDTVVQAAANQLARLPLDVPGQPRAGPDPPRIEVVSFYNPERRSAVSIVRASSELLSTMDDDDVTHGRGARARTRQHGVLIATPLSRSALMVGKVLPYAAIGPSRPR